MSCEPIKGCVMKDSTFAVKARFSDEDDTALTQSDVSAIEWSAWNPSDTKIVDAVALTVADVLSNTLSTAGWGDDVDAIGWNFKHVVNDDVCVVAGEHTIEYKVTLSGSGQTFISRKFKPDVQDVLTT